MKFFGSLFHDLDHRLEQKVWLIIIMQTNPGFYFGINDTLTIGNYVERVDIY